MNQNWGKVTAVILFIIQQATFASAENAGNVHLLVKSRKPFTQFFQNASAIKGSDAWYRLEVSSIAKTDTLHKLHSNPHVEWVEEDIRYSVQQSNEEVRPTTTNDPYLANQWSLQKMQVQQAWTLVNPNAKEVLVAVVDTGVDLNHPELASRIFTNPKEIANNGIDDDHNGYIDDVQGWDFEAKTNRANDDFNHGTHVAGIMGAIQNNQYGIAGIAPRIRILPVKWMKNGSGWGADAIEAIYYAVNMGARVINASWGGIGDSKALEEAIRYAESKNVLFVAASGNRGQDNDLKPQHPANYRFSNVISVANTNEKDELEKSSSFGLKNVDLAASGTNLLSTMMNRQFAVMSGTSMAAAATSGVASLLLNINPKLSAKDLKRILLQTVTRLPSLEGKTVSGGRVNALQAAKKVISEMKFNHALEAAQFYGNDHTPVVALDDDLSGVSFARAKQMGLKMQKELTSGNLIRPDHVQEGVQYPGLAIQFIRIVKGQETPVQGLSFKAQLHGGTQYLNYQSDAFGTIRDAECVKASFSVSVSLEAPRYEISLGQSPYTLLVNAKCGVVQRFIFDEQSPAGQVIAIWQTAVNAEKKLAKEVGLSFWKRQIHFVFPGGGDYYNSDTVNLTQGHQWDVSAHELGHAIYDQANVGVFGGGSHKIDECYSDALALSEGWASFFSAWVNLDLNASDPHFEYMVPRRAPIQVENIPANVCGKAKSEWRVMGFLWDLIDTHNDGESEAESFIDLFKATQGAHLNSIGAMKQRLLQKGWNSSQLEAIWKLNFPAE